VTVYTATLYCVVNTCWPEFTCSLSYQFLVATFCSYFHITASIIAATWVHMCVCLLLHKLKDKLCQTPWGVGVGKVLISLPWVCSLIDHWNLWCQTYVYLPNHRTSLPLEWYQSAAGWQVHVCKQLAQGCTWKWNGWVSNLRPFESQVQSLTITPLLHRRKHVIEVQAATADVFVHSSLVCLWVMHVHVHILHCLYCPSLFC